MSFTLPVSLLFLTISLIQCFEYNPHKQQFHVVCSLFQIMPALFLGPIIPYLPICDRPTTLSCKTWNSFIICYKILWKQNISTNIMGNIHYYNPEGCWYTMCFLSAYLSRNYIYITAYRNYISLYISIPHNLGLDTIKFWLENYGGSLFNFKREHIPV